MTIVLALLAIGLLVFIHELGHLLVGLWTGLPVARFSIGMGPVLAKRTWWGVEFALSAIPFGGYVLYDAEDEAYHQAPPMAHILSYLAGPAANVIVAVILYIGVASMAAGGLAVGAGLDLAAGSLRQVMEVLGALGAGQVGVSDLVGPVQMVSVGSDMVTEPQRFLNFLAFISLDLAVLNLLPIPALDGGRILIVVGQALTRRRLPVPAQVILFGGSFLLLAGLMAYVMVQDVVRLFS